MKRTRQAFTVSQRHVRSRLKKKAAETLYVALSAKLTYFPETEKETTLMFYKTKTHYLSAES